MSTRKRRHHGERYKIQAAQLLASRGEKTAKEIANQLGVTTSQLYVWRKRYADQLQESSRLLEDINITMLRSRVRELEHENAKLKLLVNLD